MPDEAQKLELYRRLARARTAGDLAAFRAGGHRPLRPDARRRSSAWSRSPSCGWPPRPPAISSISREEGWLVFRFGAALSRATAMRLLGDGGLPGVRPGDVTFASNQVRFRAPVQPSKAWALTQAVVARLQEAGAGATAEAPPDAGPRSTDPGRPAVRARL